MTLEPGSALYTSPATDRRILPWSPTCDTWSGALSFHRKGAERRASGSRISEKRRRRRGGVVPCSFEFRSRLFLGRRCGLSLTKTIKFRPVRPTQSVRSLSENCQLNPKDVTESALIGPPFRPPAGIRKWPKFRELRCPVDDIPSPFCSGQFRWAGPQFFDLHRFSGRLSAIANSSARLVRGN